MSVSPGSTRVRLRRVDGDDLTHPVSTTTKEGRVSERRSSPREIQRHGKPLLGRGRGLCRVALGPRLQTTLLVLPGPCDGDGRVGGTPDETRRRCPLILSVPWRLSVSSRRGPTSLPVRRQSWFKVLNRPTESLFRSTHL